MWSLFAACAGSYHPLPTAVCHAKAIGPPIAADAPSILGFAAVDVLPLVDGTYGVTVDPTDGGPLETATLTFNTRDPGDAQVEEQMFDVDLAVARQVCLAGPALWVPATLEVSATRTTEAGEEDWFTASGEVRIGAQGLDPEQIWVHSELVVEPRPELAAVAESEVPRGCSVSAATTRFSQNGSPWTPIGGGPVGGLHVRACETHVQIVLYRWGDALPPPLDTGG
ncbi:MAG: hypothetical protein ABMA64_26630 [Myxococcota bacterium]